MIHYATVKKINKYDMPNNPPITAEQALSRAAAYCSKAERCAHDVREKLLAWGLDNREDAEHIVDWLKEEGFIDEVRFARAYIHDKLTYDRWGRLKIVRGLAAKRLSPTLVYGVLDEVFDAGAYRATLAQLLAAKARSWERPLSPDHRMRLFRFAMQRGFEPDIVREETDRL